MEIRRLTRDDQYILNQCTKYLARTSTDPRHDFGHYEPGDPRATLAEAWRFPVIDSHGEPGTDAADTAGFNEVTFVWMSDTGEEPRSLAVVGTFGGLHRPLPLSPVGDSLYHSLTVAVPRGEVHRYLFLVDDEPRLDPINPQTTLEPNGRRWSRFFTWGATRPVTFEPWERVLIDRLTDHVLPFRTPDGQRFLAQFHDHLDRESRRRQVPGAWKLDHSVGVVNFIDKLLAREERHHLIDYRICLELIDRLLRQRNPFIEPADMPRDMFVELYDQMGRGDVPGWDHDRYENPRFFLSLLRRHTLTGAFCHPKYGGNLGAAAWSFLAERYRDDAGGTLFDWRRAIEPPLGTSREYTG